MSLVDSLIADGWLKTPHIIEAFRAINRADFVPDDMKDAAEVNEALPIGHGQTISQPLVVAFMLELLQPKPDQMILDIGCGSGYTTALLAYIVSDGAVDTKYKIQDTKHNSKVVGIEIVPELAESAKRNIAEYDFVKKEIVEIVRADGAKGYSSEAPYDRILTSAALNAAGINVQEKIPKAWRNQLKIGGRIVCPINNSIWLFVKKSENDFEATEFPGFVFVPLI